ncbi:hypothetical protein [Sphingobacterium sp. MYb388]|uniref:hypothetical protein n=1 Tax=Sphingobacterium sp. MYb388 TaxID=2745437 RepID=UPI0030AB926D
MEPIFRCATEKAIDELAQELNLPNEEWMQDWPIEVTNPSDIDRYLDHYKTLTDDDKKFLLMEGIIDATEYQPTETLFIKNCDKVKLLLEKDFHIHAYTIYQWACFDIADIEEWWKITPIIRKIWQDNHKRI